MDQSSISHPPIAWYRGLSRAQWLVLVVAWLGWTFDILDTALFNFAKGPMLTEMMGASAYRTSGATVEGWIQGLFLAGWSIGGLVFGVLADRWGRTRTLVVTILLYCLFTGLTALCRTPEQVALSRFLTALGIGGEWAAGVALVAETFPDRARAGAAALLQSAAAAGPILAALANLALAGRPWQWLFLLGVAPAGVCVLIRMGVPEPQRSEGKPRPRNPLGEVFSHPRWRKRALAAMVIGAVGVAGAGTATYWQPNLVVAASQGLAKADVDARKSFVALISHVGTLAGVLVTPWLCERFGRRRVIFGFFLATPFVVAFAIGGGAHYERLLLLLPLVNFFAIGVSAAFVLYFPELFPERIRATGAGLAYNVGRVLSIPMPIVTGLIVRAYGGSISAGVLLSGAVYALAFFALPFAPETRGVGLAQD